jgi:hypothetical protein
MDFIKTDEIKTEAVFGSHSIQIKYQLAIKRSIPYGENYIKVLFYMYFANKN